MTLDSRHQWKTEIIMNNKIRVYEAARALNPSRFNNEIKIGHHLKRHSA